MHMGGIRGLITERGSGAIRQLPPHRNRGLEIVAVLNGKLPWQVEGRPAPVEAGSVFFTFPWESHGSQADYEPGHSWHFAVIRVHGDLDRPGKLALPPCLGWPRQAQAQLWRALRSAPFRSWPFSPLLVETLAEIATFPNDGSPVKPRLTALVSLLLSELLHTLERTQRGAGSAVGDPNLLRVQLLIATLGSRYEEEWTLAQMAEVCQLRRTRLNDVVRKHTGDTPLRLLNRIRIEAARRRLRAGAEVTETAFACGYSSSQYFARQFRKLTGTTPSRFAQTTAQN